MVHWNWQDVHLGSSVDFEFNLGTFYWKCCVAVIVRDSVSFLMASMNKDSPSSESPESWNCSFCSIASVLRGRTLLQSFAKWLGLFHLRHCLPYAGHCFLGCLMTTITTCMLLWCRFFWGLPESSGLSDVATVALLLQSKNRQCIVNSSLILHLHGRLIWDRILENHPYGHTWNN